MGTLTEIWNWLQGIFSLVATKLIVAVLVLLIGIIIGKILERLMHKGLHALELDKTLQRAGTRLFLEEVLSVLAKYVVYFITVVLALETIQLTTTVINIVAAAVIIVVLAGMVLSLRDLIPNAIAGFTLMRKGTVRKGAVLEYKDITGTVMHAGLLELLIKSNNGDIYVVPNALFLQEGFTIRNQRSQA